MGGAENWSFCLLASRRKCRRSLRGPKMDCARYGSLRDITPGPPPRRNPNSVVPHLGGPMTNTVCTLPSFAGLAKCPGSRGAMRKFGPFGGRNSDGAVEDITRCLVLFLPEQCNAWIRKSVFFRLYSFTLRVIHLPLDRLCPTVRYNQLEGLRRSRHFRRETAPRQTLTDASTKQQCSPSPCVIDSCGLTSKMCENEVEIRFQTSAST